MITALVYLLIVIAILVGLAWAVDKIGVPAPLNTIFKVVLGLIGLLYVIHTFGIY